MAEQMAEHIIRLQAEFVKMCKGMGSQIQGLSSTVGAQGVAKVIPSFDGDSKCFKSWVKEIEKYSQLVGLDNKGPIMIAYQSSKGPVSDYLKRYLAENPNNDWTAVKADLTSRFADIVDPQHALLLLRRVKQKPSESVQVYAERLVAVGEDAFEGQARDAVDRQLIGYFIDGLYQDNLKMRIMRDNPTTMQQAITVATNEQNLRKRFNLRTGRDMGTNIDDGVQQREMGHQPMEIDHFRRQDLRCSYCNKRGHQIRDCRARKRGNQVNAANIRRVNPRSTSQVRCFECGNQGHYARECPRIVGQSARRSGKQPLNRDASRM
ncbi:MAG: hypothetical protein ABW185_02110 [Sedimenticola sp.]